MVGTRPHARFGRPYCTFVPVTTAKDSYIPLEQKVLSWNVEQVSISGRGIEVCQMGSQYKKDKGQPGGAQIEDEYAWRVSFPLGDIQDVWVSEGERQGSALPVITIRFSIVAAPDSRDASKLLECKTSGDSVGGEQHEEFQCEIAAEPATEAQEQSLDDDSLVDDEQPRDTTTFLLAQFFKDSSNVGLACRLDLQRIGGGKGPYVWFENLYLRFQTLTYVSRPVDYAHCHSVSRPSPKMGVPRQSEGSQ